MNVPISHPPFVTKLRSLPEPVCVAVSCAEARDLLAQARVVLPRFPFVELRLDLLTDPVQGPETLRTLRQEFPEALLLATCRPVRSGGKLHGAGDEELGFLVKAAHAGATLVDLSLETAEELGPASLDRLRAAGAAVLLSFHDFETMVDLDAVLARMQPFRPDVYKLVPTAGTLDGSIAVLRFLEAHADTPVVAMAMGEAGIPSRILGPRAGSLFTFAAADERGGTAPGQFRADDLRTLYRVGSLGSETRIYGVFGNPIRSSLSPRMLNTAFRETGLNAVYLPLKAADPAEILRTADALPLSGFSVTMPFKQSVMPLLDFVDPLARKIGAVNTVHRMPDGSLHGYNTDAAGIVVPLERRRSLEGARVLVLGAGGAARAAVFACIERGAKVSIHNRTAAAAKALAEEAGAHVLPDDRLGSEDFDVLIHATPAGMRGNLKTLPIEPDQLRAALVYDLVYNPRETPLLQLAREQGRETIEGIEMFVHQGARQFERWTGQPAPLNAMQDAVQQAFMS